MKKLALGAGAAAVAFILLTGKPTPGGTKLFYRNRAIGCHPRLLLFLDWWAKHGPFPIGVTGGGRTQADVARLYAQGRTAPGPIVTNAKSILETAHGPRLAEGKKVFCAVDVAPAILSSSGATVAAFDYNDRSKFERIGYEAKQGFGLEWGGDFPSFDGPHVQIAGWRNLPAVSTGPVVA